MKIKIGPSGLGPVKTSEEVLGKFKSWNFGVCELAFTHSVYVKKDDAVKIGNAAKSLGIDLSIHAPYFVNLNSPEKDKVEASKQRILKCCEIGEALGARKVVFHPGYYGAEFGKAKTSEEVKGRIKVETYDNIKKNVLDMMSYVKDRKWKIKLAPEIMGKVNVFGSPEEIAKLVEETDCSFCIDYAHILAREKKVDYEKIEKLFPQKEWHVHFSGIEYNEKGERRHLDLERKQWKDLFNNLPKDREISIVCESPSRVENCIEGLGVLDGVRCNRA